MELVAVVVRISMEYLVRVHDQDILVLERVRLPTITTTTAIDEMGITMVTRLVEEDIMMRGIMILTMMNIIMMDKDIHEEGEMHVLAHLIIGMTKMETMTTTTTIPMMIMVLAGYPSVEVETVEGDVQLMIGMLIQIPIGIMLNEGILCLIHPIRRVLAQLLHIQITPLMIMNMIIVIIDEDILLRPGAHHRGKDK